jgi:hypothetical protein
MTNNGKATGGMVLTVIVAALMVLSVALVAAAAVPTAAASSSAGATGAAVYPAPAVAPPTTAPFTLTLNPAVFTFSAGLLSTIVTVSGATFTANALVHFCVSTTSAFTVATPTSVGTYQLPLATTTMSNVAVPLSGGDATGGVTGAGNYYIAATDSAACAQAPTATYTTPVAITVTSAAPTLSVATSPTTVGSSDGLSGGAWDAGATVTVYLTQAPATLGGSPVTGSQVLGTFTTTSGGDLPASASFTVPTLPLGPYDVVAQETSGPAAAVSVGITADSSFTIEPAITVTPFYFNGAASSVLTISGTGFAAGDTIAAAVTASSVIEISAPAAVETTHAAATASSLGVFSGISVTTATAQNAAHSGPQSISITAGSGTYTFTAAVFVSNPNPGGLGFHFAPVASLEPTSPIAAEAWNFPSGATVTFYMGSVVLGTETASSLGFAQLPATAVLPGMPAGTYYAVAADVSAGLYSTPDSVGVIILLAATDPSGAALGGEYLPSGGMITVSAYGLIPGTAYSITDTFLGPIGLSRDVVSVSVGSLSAAGSFYPGANGTLIFTYSAAYAGIAGATTGTSSTIAVVTPVASIDTYKSIGAPGISTADFTSFKAGATSASVAFSNLIPGDAAALYSGSPAVSTLYNVYIGTSILTGTAGTTPACSATAPTVCSASNTGGLTLDFTVPSATGVMDLAIVYNGQPTSAALAMVPVIVSSPGTSAGSGTIAVVTDPTSTDTIIVGFNLLPGATTYDLNISISSGVHLTSPSVSAAGAMAPYDLTTSGFMDEPAGTYSIILFVVSATGASASLVTSYTVGALLTITSPALADGPIGTTIVASASGLAPTAYYDVYFAGQYMETVATSSAGDVTLTGGTAVIVPEIAPGAYALSLDPTGTTTVAVSATFTVTAPTSIVMTPDPSAFPGQLVNFAWTPATAPTIGVASIEVTVLLNGTAFTTFPAVDTAGTLSGSFLMPNAPAGTSWFLQLEWSQTTDSVVGGVGGSTYTTYTSTGIISLQLVAGSGAFVLSISQNDMTHIATLSGQYVNITLANLGAKISGIYAVGNKTFASLTTGFGNMTTSLSAIDATVTANAAGIANIQNGLVTIDSTLGTMTAALSAIGATVVSISNNVVVLNSTLGTMSTTLSALNAYVASITSGVATLKTDVGQIQVNLTAVGAQLAAFQTSATGTLATITSTLGTMTTTLSTIGTTVTNTQNAVNIAVGDLVVVKTDLGAINGTVLSINGGIATIQTSLGTLQASVNNLPTVNNSGALNTLTTLLYVVIVLVIITLALAAVLLTRAGRRPPSEPPKAFEAPKTP